MENKTKNNARSWLVILTIAVVFIMLYRMNPAPSQPRELTTLEFYEALSRNAVSQPVVRLLDRENGSTCLKGSYRVEETDPETKETREATVDYVVPLVPGENEKMMEFLLQKGVQVKVEEHRSMFSPLVVNILFFIGMIAAFYWLFARKMGGENGPFGLDRKSVV